MMRPLNRLFLLGADVGWHSINFDEVDLNGEQSVGSKASGHAIGLRAAVQLTFGGASKSTRAEGMR